MKKLLGVSLAVALFVGCAGVRKDVGLEKVTEQNGILVNAVAAGGAAEQAGLRKGDIIVAYEGQKIVDPAVIEKDIAAAPEGKKVVLKVVRGQKIMDIEMPVPKRPSRIVYIQPFPGQPYEQAIRIAGDYLWVGSYPYPISIKAAEAGMKLLPEAIQGPDQTPATPTTFFSIPVR